MPLPDLIPVDHDPFAPIPKAGQTIAPQNVLGEQRGIQVGVTSGLSNVFGLTDAAKALRGELTPEEAQNFALTALPGLIPGARAEKTALEVASEAAPAVAKGIRAYHGSPYDFDRFDISKIGTGEGAQAYGHGLYFAENPSVAEAYKGAAPAVKWQGESVPVADAAEKLAPLVQGPQPYNAARLVSDWAAGGLDTDAMRVRLARGAWNDEQKKSLLSAINASEGKLAFDKGHTYEVSINADPSHFLDWDKPLSEQHPRVQDAIKEINYWGANIPPKNNVGAETTGGQLVDYLERRYGNKVDATGDLKEFGIPGIKYLDHGSRGSGQGTHNYVVFDDKLIDIVKKYGLAGLIAGGWAHHFTQPVDHDPFAEAPH